MKTYTPTELKLKAEKKCYFDLWQESKKLNSELLEACEDITYQGGLMEFMEMHCPETREKLEQAIRKAKGEK